MNGYTKVQFMFYPTINSGVYAHSRTHDMLLMIVPTLVDEPQKKPIIASIKMMNGGIHQFMKEKIWN